MGKHELRPRPCFESRKGLDQQAAFTDVHAQRVDALLAVQLIGRQKVIGYPRIPEIDNHVMQCRSTTATTRW